jgi:hypothetical protein
MSYDRFHSSAAKYIRTGLFCVITQRVVLISYRRFGTTYRVHPQRSRIPPPIGFLALEDEVFFYSCPLKMEPISCPETSVRNYRYSLRSYPEGRSSHVW